MGQRVGGVTVAPGHRLVADTNKTTLYNKYTTWRFPALPGWSGQYVRLSGSSMAAAVANAVYHATGKRVRRLPIRIEDLL